MEEGTTDYIYSDFGEKPTKEAISVFAGKIKEEPNRLDIKWFVGLSRSVQIPLFTELPPDLQSKIESLEREEFFEKAARQREIYEATARVINNSETMFRLKIDHYKPVKIKSREAEGVLGETVIEGGPTLAGKILTVDYLNEKGTNPAYKLSLKDRDIYFSKPYHYGDEDEPDRPAFTAYLKGSDGKYHARSYYRSHSQGVYRLLPYYERREGDEGTVVYAWLHKGFFEESLNLPIFLQYALGKITENEPLVYFEGNENVFLGTTIEVTPDEWEDYLKYNHPIPGRRASTDYVEAFQIEDHAIRLADLPYLKGGEFYSPQDYTYSHGDDRPDFSRRLASWSQKNALYGPLVMEVYPSANSGLNYLYARDKRNRVWVACIECDGVIGKTTGLNNKQPRLEAFTIPAYEYGSQTFEGEVDESEKYRLAIIKYENTALTRGNYVDMFKNYVSKLEPVRLYMEARKGNFMNSFALRFLKRKK